MIDGKTPEQHTRALVYLDTIIGKKDEKYNSLTNVDAANKMVQKCSEILNIDGTFVYNFPLTPQYDVYNGDKHCFEVYLSPLKNDIVMLTINDVRFDSRNYDSKTFQRLADLWNATKQKCKKSLRENER